MSSILSFSLALVLAWASVPCGSRSVPYNPTDLSICIATLCLILGSSLSRFSFRTFTALEINPLNLSFWDPQTCFLFFLNSYTKSES